MTSIDTSTLKPGRRIRVTRCVEGVISIVGQPGAPNGALWVEFAGDGGVLIDGTCTVEVMKAPLPFTPGSVIVAQVAGHSTPMVLTLDNYDGGLHWHDVDDDYTEAQIMDWRHLDGLDTRNPHA